MVPALTSLRLAAAVAALLVEVAVAYAQLVADGGEFQVNTYTPYGQHVPAVVFGVEPDEFLVVWSGDDEAFPATAFGILGQRFRFDGERLGSEFRINQDPAGVNIEEVRSALAATSKGFVVVWESVRGRDGDQEGIFGRRLNSQAQPLGDDFLVNEYTTGTQRDPAVAALRDGGFVVAWVDSQAVDYFDDSRIFGRKYDSSGVATGSAFPVALESGPIRPAIAPLPENRFVVVWQAIAESRDAERVVARRFEGDGTAIGTASPLTPGFALSPAVTSDGEGRVVAVWTGVDTSLEADIFGRTFDAQMTPLGSEFAVNTYTTGIAYHALTTFGRNGEFVVIWKNYSPDQDGSGRGVFGRYFSADGTPAGTEFQVNTYTTADQGGGRHQEVGLASADNRFVVVWSSQYQDGHLAGIFGQRYCVEDRERTCGDVSCRTSTTPGTSSLTITTADALGVLLTALGARECAPCVCDADGSGQITARDALLVLRAASGLSAELRCPACAQS